MWTKRRRNMFSEGRIYTASPAQAERCWLRMLLTTVKGACSYDDVATVEGYLHGSFKEAAIALGLVADDDEQDNMLQPASLACFPSQMRALFAEVLVWHEPLEPAKLCAKRVDEMAADFLYRDQQRLHNPALQMNDALRNRALLDVDLRLQKMGKAGLSEWKQMPQPTETSSDISQLESAERSFNKEAVQSQLEQQLPILEANPEQAEAYAAIKDAIDGNASAEVNPQPPSLSKNSATAKLMKDAKLII
ncbi:hypothetical protein WJX82_003046 [Trebouxia sp. C0006]